MEKFYVGRIELEESSSIPHFRWKLATLAGDLGFSPVQTSYFVSESSIFAKASIRDRGKTRVEVDIITENKSRKLTLSFDSFIEFSARSDHVLVETDKSNQLTSLSLVSQQAQGLNLDMVNIRELLASTSEKESFNKAINVKSEFLAVMTHELRTPLNAIIGFNNLIEQAEELDNEEKRYYCNQIGISAENLLKTIGNILNFQDEAANCKEATRQTINADKFVSKIVDEYKPQIEEKGLKFAIQHGLQGKLIYSDFKKIHMIVVCLLSNAIRFTSKGAITLKIEKCSDRGGIYISVADTGIGIPEGEHEKIFNEFYQIDYSSTRGMGGLGLGLARVKACVGQLLGKISLDSQSGKGSSFALWIPCEVKDQKRDPKEKTLWISESRNFSVLVAEDTKTNMILIERWLTKRGIAPLKAENGKVAFELAIAERPDLILMDINMPVMDGFEAISLLRYNLMTRDIPVFVLSASQGCEFFKKCEDYAVHQVFQKPLKFLDLETEIGKVFKGDLQTAAQNQMVTTRKMAS